MATKNGGGEVEPATIEPAKCDKSITVMIPGAIRNEWKAFFATHGLSLSFGIRVAIDHLIADVNDGRGSLRITGYIPTKQEGKQ